MKTKTVTQRYNSRRHTAGHVLLGRPAGLHELRRRGLRDRARDDARVRQPGPAVRQVGQPARLVAPGDQRPVRGPGALHGPAVRRLLRGGRGARERAEHAGREHRGQRGRGARVQRVPAPGRGRVARPRAPSARAARVHGPADVLDQRGQRVVLRVPARDVAAHRAHRPPRARPVPRHRRVPEPAALRRRLPVPRRLVHEPRGQVQRLVDHGGHEHHHHHDTT